MKAKWTWPVCVVVVTAVLLGGWGRLVAQDIIEPGSRKKEPAEKPAEPAPEPTKVNPEGIRTEEGTKETGSTEEMELLKRLQTLLETRVKTTGDVDADRRAALEGIDNTLAAADEYLKRFPDGKSASEVRMQKALLFYQRFRYGGKPEDRDQAMDVAAKLIADKPKDPWSCKAHALRMQLLRARKKYDEAIAEAQAIVKEFPKDDLAPEAQYYLYDLYRRKEQPDKAEQALKELAEKFPETSYGIKAAGMLKRVKLPGQVLEITFTKPDETTFKLSDQRGKVVLVTYWSTENKGSVELQKQYLGLHDLYAEKGLVIIGVNLDRGKPTFDEAMAGLKVPWVQCFDGKTFLSPMATAVGVTVIPSNVLVDRQGKVYGLDVALEGLQLRQAIVDLLGKK